MGKRVAGVRVGGADGGLADRQVIGVAGPDALPVALRALAYEALGPELAHHPARCPGAAPAYGAKRPSG